ncbi:uncharacterized protein N7459_002192 [Penicillium hispanicum]|uniref:uncharacterized protein n=1 Tax=Penicillium hispanicum TaxID=1080232 RepID=UPI0025406431|nr:uncharacterized protein N7459_002192 [Penicillium hispanicum]KAJ5591823.1 hypothetical protein N7459_002192 [Penicillium hispanicum]
MEPFLGRLISIIMSNASCKFCPILSVYEWKQGHEWRRHQISAHELKAKREDDSLQIISEDTQVYIIIASANVIRRCQPCRQDISNAFHIPETWWTNYYRKSNGYFGCGATRDAQGILTGFNAWAFFETKHLALNLQYHWTKINVFTRWLSSTNQTGVLVFDPNEHFPRPLLDLRPMTSHLNDPLWVYVKVLNEVSCLQESAVWATRDQIRAIEKQTNPPGRPQPDYRRLHDIARHTVHVTESLDVSIQNLGHILSNHARHMNRTFPSLLGTRQDPDVWQDIHAELTASKSYLDSLKLRSISNEKRLQNEIQLAFNTVAQHDAAITVEISKAMRADSSTITTLTADSGWSVSGKIWIYWAFAIPTAIGTALLWNYWHRIFPHSEVEQLRRLKMDIPMQDRP